VDLFALIEAALQESSTEREEIECLAVGIGPGSYTGLRGAIALAQGWQLARGIQLSGISSAECIAADAASLGMVGRVSVVIDAQRGEFYLATYELIDNTFHEREPLRLAKPEEVRNSAAAGSLVIGPEVQRWFPNGTEVNPTAPTLGRLALQRAHFQEGFKIEPIYLRETTFIKAPPPRVLT
jgi:tRNA threonylcarbamoyl adenosine modification protein YeaZ